MAIFYVYRELNCKSRGNLSCAANSDSLFENTLCALALSGDNSRNLEVVIGNLIVL